jgi:predicted outer membrane repeat protein
MVEATIEDLDSTIRFQGNLTESDGGAVLSTTLPMGQNFGAVTGTEIDAVEFGVIGRSSPPPRKAVSNGVKNLHGSKAIHESPDKALWYQGQTLQ